MKKESFENVKDWFVIYKSYYQHASGGTDEVFYFYKTADDAIAKILDLFGYDISNEKEHELRQNGITDTGDFALGILKVSDISEDDNYCEWTTNEKLAGEVIVTVTNANSSNTQRRHLVRSEFLMDC